MKLFVYPNLLSEKQIETAKDVIKTLRGLGHKVSLSNEDKKMLKDNEEFSLFKASEADYIVSVGGDACALKAAKIAFKEQKPLLGINSGHVGFLCAIKANEVSTLTDEKIRSLNVESRTVLEIHYDDKTYIAFNDAIIGKANIGKIVRINYSINNEEQISFKGDGLIIATPLGSTGYNYSAGGDKIDEDSNLFCVTPISPSFREIAPFKVNNNSIISVNSPFSYENKTILCIDGIEHGELKEMITIKKSNKYLLLLK